MSGVLYLVAVPIGEYQDISYRAVETLKNADVVLCEDMRRTGVLFKEFGISTPLENYHEHNAEEKMPEVIKRVLFGEKIALVSDAGTPLISDPGFRLVKKARAMNVPMTALPGACAAVNALVLSGLPSSQFYFHGFLPNKSSARIKKLEELKTIPATLIFYEAPHRIEESTKDFAKVFGDGAEISMAREMTKKYESVFTGSASDLVEYVEKEKPKGEIALLVNNIKTEIVSEYDVEARLKELLKEMSVKDAVILVVKESGKNKKEVYSLALELKGA